MLDLLYDLFSNCAKFQFPRDYVMHDDFTSFVVQIFELSDEDEDALYERLETMTERQVMVDEVWDYLHQENYFDDHSDNYICHYPAQD